MSEEMKLCPFCGTLPKVTEVDENYKLIFGDENIYQIYHDIQNGCHLSICTPITFSKEKAIEIWNKRA